jgi:hypothetical protein
MTGQDYQLLVLASNLRSSTCLINHTDINLGGISRKNQLK